VKITKLKKLDKSQISIHISDLFAAETYMLISCHISKRTKNGHKSISGLESLEAFTSVNILVRRQFLMEELLFYKQNFIPPMLMSPLEKIHRERYHQTTQTEETV
jgi:hypothetical protein